jgi:lysophospholipase L1-like esterase
MPLFSDFFYHFGQIPHLIDLSESDHRLNDIDSKKKYLRFRNMKTRLLGLLLLTGLLSHPVFSQTLPFEEEVKQISARLDSSDWASGTTVFTGSSTIRMWKTLEENFPNTPLINTGFGGSKASDLEKHLFPLVIKFDPKRVFIYEGDNDLWSGVPVSDILQSLDNIVTRIHLVNPSVEIYLIGAKPSPSRWDKKENYLIFNQLLKEYCLSKDMVEFVDNWRALTDSQGNPRPELYIQDMLHLNEKGYQVWTEIFRPILNH